MLAYVTSPFKKKKKKKTSTREGKKADVDADNLDALLERIVVGRGRRKRGK